METGSSSLPPPPPFSALPTDNPDKKPPPQIQEPAVTENNPLQEANGGSPPILINVLQTPRSSEPAPAKKKELTTYDYGEINHLPNYQSPPKYWAKGEDGPSKTYTSQEIKNLCKGAEITISTPPIKFALKAPDGYVSKKQEETLKKREAEKSGKKKKDEFDGDDFVDTSTVRGKLYLRLLDLAKVDYEWRTDAIVELKSGKAVEKWAIRNRIMSSIDALVDEPMIQTWELRGCYRENRDESLLFYYNNPNPKKSDYNDEAKKSWYIFSANHSNMAYLGDNKIAFRVLFPRILTSDELTDLVGGIIKHFPKFELPRSNTQIMGVFDVRENVASTISSLPETFVPQAFGPIQIATNETTGVKTDWDPITGSKIDLEKTKHGPNPTRNVFMSLPGKNEFRTIGALDVLQLPVDG